jgi:hypothetical protein
MKTEIKIPYSEDTFTVETESIKSLYGLRIVRFSVGQRCVALTGKAANELGQALLDASDDATPSPSWL